MNKKGLARLVALTAAWIVSHAHAQTTNAPLHLFINGGGSVSPFTNGESLVVGQAYNMVATPDAGFVFSSWQPANVFTLTAVTIDASGNSSTNVSVVSSLLPIFTNQPSLNFVMQPETLIVNNPGVMTTTKGAGWQANFEPILLSIELSDLAVIVNWQTNFTGYHLQSTTNLSLPAWTTNLRAPVVVNGQYTVTNPISDTQRFFRLSQ